MSRFQRDWTQGDPLPAELASALDAAPDAARRFAELSPSHQREFVRWVAQARRPDMRERRAAQAVMRLLSQESGTADE